MKITHRKITASTEVPVQIPVPFNNYYDIVSEDELAEYTGYKPAPGEPTPCEAANGYNINHLAWVLAKPDVRDWLADADIDIAELVTSDWDSKKPQLAYAVGKKIFPIEMSDIADAINGTDRYVDADASEEIQGQPIEASAMPKIPAPFDEYYQIMSDEEVEELTGEPAHPSPCEDCEGYEVKNLCYLTPKKQYEEAFFNNGVGDVEVLQEGNVVFVGYCVHDRIYQVGWPDLEQILEESGISYDEGDPDDETDEREEAFGDDPVAGIATMFSISYEDAEKIFDWYDAEGATEDYDSIRDFLDFVNDDIRDMLDAADDQEFANRIRVAIGDEPIESCNQVSVNSAVDTGLEYWYFSRHGFGIGTIPKGVQVLDWYEEGYKTWMKLDKMLTTAELNEFDLKEQTPPEGVTTHNGDIIEGCSNINASECKQVSEDDDSIEYVVTNTEINSDNVEACDVSFFDKAAQQIEGQSNEIDTCSTVEGNSSVNKIDIDALKAELNDAIIEYMISEGFTRPGTPKESKYDVYADDYFVLEVTKDSIDNEDCIKCEVRAELGFDGFMRLTEEFLDPIVKKYDKDSYFDMVDGGIAEAYIVNANRPIEGASDDSAAIDKLRESYLNSEDDAETANVADVTPEDIIIEIPVDAAVNVEEDTAWKLEDASFLEDYVTDDISLDKLAEDFQDVLAWAVPAEAGKYNIKADVTLVYTASPALYEGYSYFLNPKESKVTPSSVEPASKIEESTKVQEGQEVTAASEPMMTEADLDQAILEGKPFDLASFKKYKSKAMSPDILTADKIEAGDIIAVTEDATEVNLGTVVKIISVNDSDHTVDWADYTFHVLLMESPEKYWNRGLDPYRNSTLQPGDEMDLHFDADDYVGPLVLE